MARISLAQVRSLPDIIASDAFDLLLGSLPGAGDSGAMTIKCLNANIPGFSNEAFEVALHGHVVKFRGRKTYPRQLSVTFVEDATFDTLNKLRNWHETVVGTSSGDSGGDKADYSVTAALIVRNHKGEAINTMVFYSLWPQDVPDIQLSGESTQLMQVSVTFTYDYFEADGHTSL